MRQAGSARRMTAGFSHAAARPGWDKKLTRWRSSTGSRAPLPPRLSGDCWVIAEQQQLRAFAAKSLIYGGRTRTRTWDPLIKSQLLYQLSYAPPRGKAR